MSTKDPVEIAAAQAAIWHFSDSFELDASNANNDAAVVARYNVLVGDATANPVTSEPAGSLDVTPSSASAIQGSPVFYDITTTATAALSIELSDAAVSAHPASATACDAATTITTVTGNSRVCLTSTDPRVNVKMTVRTGSAPVSAGRVFIRPARQKLIIGKSGAAQSTDTVTSSWTANNRPSVSIGCPSDGVRYGALSTFTAKATDPDGDALTHQWSLNGVAISGATAKTVEIALGRGDKLTVTVTDSVGQFASADATCPGRNTPTVRLSCPDRVELGSTNTFTAVGDDPDGDILTYQWSLNGVALNATNGPTLSIKVDAGDVLTVVAVDSSGSASAPSGADCLPPSANHKPTVTVSCPAKLVYGQPAVFTAVGTDLDGDELEYTWSINSTVIAGQSGPTATLTINMGDMVQVVVNDSALDSDPATVTCTGTTPNRPPTVKVGCPADLVWGESTSFTATGTDPDGDTLAYSWKINGAVVKGATGPELTTTVNKGDLVTVVATDGAAASSDQATANCAGNGRPKVSLNCPTGSVPFGEPVMFTASGFDADGDALTYLWKVNGKVVVDQIAADAILTIAKGDVVSVSAEDPGGLTSDSVKVTCAGNARPAVTITCPTNLVWGEPFAFIANGIDPDGDIQLVYTWTLNSKVVAGTTGPKLTATMNRGDVLTVTVTDSDGAVSSPAAGNCAGSNRPTVSLTCPAEIVFGEPTDFAAVGTDLDGDKLTYEWKVNGKVVTGRTGPSAALTIAKGDTVTVTVTDTRRLTSTAATSTCAGTSRPTVALSCPPNIIWGDAATFTGIGQDADRDSLSYRWSVNGTVVEGQTGPTIRLTLGKGDVVGVSVTDSTGLASASVTVACVGTNRPTVTMNCPVGLVFGEPATFTALGVDPDGDEISYAWFVNGKAVNGQSGASLIATIAKGDAVSVTVTDTKGATSTVATTPCSGNSRPKVELECPAKIVYGEPTGFSAQGNDADGDPLAYQWSVNGTVVIGSTGPTASLVIAKGDTVSVSVADADGLTSAEASSNCVGTARPKVKLVCPAKIVYGEPTTFEANGTDADGDTLIYTWRVNGQILDAQSGPTVLVALSRGDKISVTAADATGLASEQVSADCAGTSRPTVSITCPASLVFGEPTRFTAIGVDPDGDTALTYTWSVNGVPVPDNTISTLTTTLARADVLTVAVTDPDGATSTLATATCAGNGRPSVALTCPAKLVYGEPTSFTATGTDPDGDAVSYEWRINDKVVSDQTAATATLTLAKGDRVSVTATDDKGLVSATAISDCVGTARPKVATTCPKMYAYGEPADFEAIGTDADGDSLTYQWMVNGKLVETATGPNARLTPAKGDKVTVTATDPTGNVSSEATFDCVGGTRPTVALACPTPVTFGKPATFVATGSTGDGSALLYTWAINGVLQTARSGASAALTLAANDKVSVNASTATGLVSQTVTVICGGTTVADSSITRQAIPTTPQVFSRKVAGAVVAAMSLPATGARSADLALAAAATIAVGAMLLVVGRRRGRRAS